LRVECAEVQYLFIRPARAVAAVTVCASVHRIIPCLPVHNVTLRIFAPTCSPRNGSTLQKSRPPSRRRSADLGLADDDDDFEEDVASRQPPTIPSLCTSSLDDGNDDATLHHPAPDLCLRVLYATGMNDALASNESNKTRRRLAMCRLVDARYRRRSSYRDPQCLFVFSAILTVLYIHLAKTSPAPHLNPSVFAHNGM
jgi:hypothetical protein